MRRRLRRRRREASTWSNSAIAAGRREASMSKRILKGVAGELKHL